MHDTKISVTICVIMGLFASIAAAGSPTSDGSLLQTDLDDPNMPKWFDVGTFAGGTVYHDASPGNPGGSLRIQNGTPDEAWARANMVWAPADWST
jgi:hypothetical protein